MSDLSLEHQVSLLPFEEQEKILAGLDMEELQWDWGWGGRPSQRLPVGPEQEGSDDWTLAVALAGRGFG